jgi:hypothetical protein
MADLPLVNAPGYIVKVYDHDSDDLARYFVVRGAADGEEASAWIVAGVPEKSGHAHRNATQAEVEGMAPGAWVSISASKALLG